MGKIVRNLWIILVLGPCQQHNTGAHEAAEIVDVAIDDTVISHDPSPEPDDLLQPQVFFQHLLHPFSAQVRISWCMEQALLRAHQCPAERYNCHQFSIRFNKPSSKCTQINVSCQFL